MTWQNRSNFSRCSFPLCWRQTISFGFRRNHFCQKCRIMVSFILPLCVTSCCSSRCSLIYQLHYAPHLCLVRVTYFLLFLRSSGSIGWDSKARLSCYCDFGATFYRVIHLGLLYKLRCAHGFGSLFSVIEHYLSNHKPSAVENGGEVLLVRQQGHGTLH